MTLQRRSLLQIPVAVAASPAVATELLPKPSATAPDLAGRATTLAAFVDTLLPAWEDSPAASSLGVPARILTVAGRRPPYAGLLSAGCNWLDAAARARHGSAFADLAPADREAIAAAAETSARGSGPAQFFAIVHRHAMELFYSHPDAWPALAYAGPPQPIGFMDYADPPARRPA